MVRPASMQRSESTKNLLCCSCSIGFNETIKKENYCRTDTLSHNSVAHSFFPLPVIWYSVAEKPLDNQV